MNRIWTFVNSGMATALLIPLLWVASIGRYEAAEHWLLDVYFAKEHHADEISSPRIIIVSGSNALFGLDSRALRTAVGRPVVNLAGHPGLSLAFHADMALRHAKAGDIVVMPLEFGYYAAEPALTSWQAANMQSWGAGYIHWTPATVYRYFHHSSFTSLIERVLVRRIPHDAQGPVLQAVDQNSKAPVSVWRGYSYKSMNSFGDILVAKGDRPFKGPARYTTGQVTPFAIATLQTLQQHLMDRGARLLLTWPVTVKSPDFDLSTDRDRNVVAEIRRTLESSGLHVICDARAFQFDRSSFLDTDYHLNAAGGHLRAEAMASCLLNADRALIGRI